ncbi:hypothetical protein TraAM80_01202 [Trypanosoma rangeli]|uniref:Uncharacterized protein n=1 Tax=Trypanosoma rangeli TaxID=5698 RepID=A0A3R7P0Z4_TRYRA|nr:uncharacterized protein TraAM80_01202 [Trypanosoma rangeli]RNF10937.1 hypothetical protein TraAM80_01202 [Trypanosoma rangeli]|eukprot:RNF10937.1 hypothetical protein TraAM80_01202 [Trypanosoma rangeli]
MSSVSPLEGACVERRQGGASLPRPELVEQIDAGKCGQSGRFLSAATQGTEQLPYVLSSASTCAVPLSEALEPALHATVEALATSAAEAESDLINACAPPPTH